MDTFGLVGVFSPQRCNSRRSSNDLVIFIKDTDDKLTVKDYFNNDSPLNRIERIKFADGTVWDVDEI